MIQRYTWDGVPVAQDQPHGAAVIVRRPAAQADGYEYLILHRAHQGPDYDGDWAWTPPSGSRQPGEPVVGAAVRELAEETGLTAAPADLRAIDLSGGWAQFLLDVPPGNAARLDAEHDRFEWLPAAKRSPAVSRPRSRTRWLPGYRQSRVDPRAGEGGFRSRRRDSRSWRAWPGAALRS